MAQGGQAGGRPGGVRGHVAPGLEPVARAVAKAGPGVAVAAYLDGRLILDVTTDDLRASTLLCTWSAIKPVTGACLLTLVERGAIGLDDRVTDVWPEIGDDRLLVRHLLTHTAGRVSVGDVDLADWPSSVAALAAAPPDWPPGVVVCEHAQTFGHLVGEVLRRVDGRTPGRFLAEEIAGPLDLDLHIGLRPDDQSRVAATIGMDEGWWASQRGPVGSPAWMALGPWRDPNEPAWMAAEIPAVNGFATARGLAGFWQAFLEGRLPTGLGEVGAAGRDLFLDRGISWSLAGGQLDEVEAGMGGLGGQWAGVRRAEGLAWAFLTCRAGDHQRADHVEQALLAAIR